MRHLLFSAPLRALVSLCVAVAALIACGAAGAASAYNLHMTVNDGPDFADIDSLIASVCDRWETDQEKCIAIWSLARNTRRQTSCAHEGARLIWDPILHYNSYGTMNCGVVSGLNIAMWQRMGYETRYIQLGDHTVSEVSWDGGKTWHLFDSSMSFYCFNHEGAVASSAEIQASHGCALSGGKSEPGHYYLYHGAPDCVSHNGPDGWRYCSDQPVAYERTQINGASSYTDGFDISEYSDYARYGRRYVLNVAPYQQYTRYWEPRDGEDWFRPVKGKDPNEHHDLGNIRGNGVWEFRPDLGGGDLAAMLYDWEGIAQTDAGVLQAAAGETGWAIFKVAAANVITAMELDAVAFRDSEANGLSIAVSTTAGMNWTPVWEAEGTGEERIALHLRDAVAGATECLIKFEMRGAGISGLSIRTMTQVNRRALPALALGNNRIAISGGPQSETAVAWPELHAGKHTATAYAVQDVFSADEPDGMYKATLGAGENGQDCFAVWRLGTPTEMEAVTLGAVATNRSAGSSVSLHYSFDGEDYTEYFRKSDGDAPFDKLVLHDLAGDEIPAGAKEVYFKGVFRNERGGAGTYGMEGMQDLFLRVEHEPRTDGNAPFLVTYNWTEHRNAGDVTRSHTARVAALPIAYEINAGGYRPPTMNWVRVEHADTAADTKLGYSDGEDVGPGERREKQRYTWGENLALGKPYTARVASSEESGNADTDGTELTNGVVIAPTDYATSEMVQSAVAFWEGSEFAVFTVDLGTVREIAGVRVATQQPNAAYNHPQGIAVEVSEDGSEWRGVGMIHHEDLWFPPGGYEAWEHDDDPSYEELPAGGRLAYRFPLVFDAAQHGRYVRFTCTPLPGRGMGISELQVFDAVKVAHWPGF